MDGWRLNPRTDGAPRVLNAAALETFANINRRQADFGIRHLELGQFLTDAIGPVCRDDIQGNIEDT